MPKSQQRFASLFAPLIIAGCLSLSCLELNEQALASSHIPGIETNLNTDLNTDFSTVNSSDAILVCQAAYQNISPFGEPRVLIDDAAIIQAQSQQLEKVELTVTAPVNKLLAEEDYRLPHQRFLIGLSNGSTVLVANDLKYGQYVPIQAGDIVTIRGEYIWNRLGGVLHWTHHSDEPNHVGGWIQLNGVFYQ